MGADTPVTFPPDRATLRTNPLGDEIHTTRDHDHRDGTRGLPRRLDSEQSVDDDDVHTDAD